MRKAFTLIELLIVVAIIAILAAIAVPNFLEAQMRAKVSRAKADMRTFATAVESYTVDANKIMTVSNDATWTGSSALNGPSLINSAFTGDAWCSYRFKRLTTPVAYLTSVLADPFALKGDTILTNGTPSINYDTYDFINAYDFAPGGRFTGTPFRGGGITSGAGWRLASAGPDKIQRFGGSYTGVATNAYGVDYDPTNGSVSGGDIIRVGGGVAPLDPSGTRNPCIDRILNKQNENPLTP